MLQDSFAQIFDDKQRVMIVMAHPDDAEIYAGGTLARLVSENKNVLVITVTNGNKGSRQECFEAEKLATLRKQETNIGMHTLGISSKQTVCLAFADGEITNDLPIIERLAYHIRSFKPDLLISHNPEQAILKLPNGSCMVNHRDHRNTSLATIDAAYPYSRDLLFFPEHFTESGVTSHTVKNFLFADYYTDTSLHVEITPFVETKLQAMIKHTSQISEKLAEQYLTQFTKKEDNRWFETFQFTSLTH